MSNRKLKERLVLKRVGLEHLAQFNELLRYVFQVTNAELQKSGYEDGELIRSKRPMLERADVFGWFNGENLVSQVCTYPCEVNINGRVFNMGGLTGVGTYPEYAGMGLMNDLIRKALERMRAKEQWISYLYPYSIPYYRRKGWEIMSDHLTFTVKDSQLPKQVEVPGFVERKAIDHPDVIRTYDLFARQTHGALIRNKLDWEEYWRWENEDERIAALYYNEAHEPTGYIMYWIEDDIFHLKEMVYLNQEARRGLWNFISAHYSMIDEVRGHIYRNEPLAFYLDDSQIEETIEPYFMARIVDVQSFLKYYPFVDFYDPFHFVVSDPLAEWNNGIFSVTGRRDGCNLIGREPTRRPVVLDIRTLTSMLMNSVRSLEYPYVLDYGLWGLRAQTAYDQQGRVAWALHVEYAKGQPSRILVRVLGRKDLVYMDLEREAGSGRLLAVDPVGLDDENSKLPLISLSSGFPARTEYGYDERGRLSRVSSFEVLKRTSAEPVRQKARAGKPEERFERVRVSTSSAYAYDDEGRLVAMSEKDGAGTRVYGFKYAPAERRVYRQVLSGDQAVGTEPDCKQYDAAGRLEFYRYSHRVGSRDLSSRLEYRRDEQGRVVLVRETLNGEQVKDFCYRYDEKGNMIRYSERRPGQEESRVGLYEYDDRGNWIRASLQNINEGEGPRAEPAVVERRVKYMQD